MSAINRFTITVLIVLLSFHYSKAEGDFKVKGFHLDMRTQVMTPEAIKMLVKQAAQDGMNVLIMEYEATFPFEHHSTICNRHAYTKQEVRDIIDYCALYGIDVIPLQNCFGHCEYILRHHRYSSLREDKKEVSQVCPVKFDEAEKIFSEIFSEIAAAHPSKYIHIGADETRLLGHCPRCARKVKEEGVSRLFVDYVVLMCKIVSNLGKTPIIWADMILQHPEALKELPKDLIIMDWNYGWKADHFGDPKLIIDAGYTVWGATALRSSPDNSYLVTWNKHLDNLSDFIPYARANGYQGIINTSWSTSGQYGFIYDASWEVSDMQPIRQVYPLSGFDMLQKAFVEAVSSQDKFDQQAFITAYARDHFGFDKEGQEVLLSYFTHPQKAVNAMKYSLDKISKEYDDCMDLRLRLGALKPSQNNKDFRHLELMLDIRLNYLSFKILEMRYESDTFTDADRNDLAKQLKPLLKDAEGLRKRFVAMNREYLKDPSDIFGKWDYITKMQNVYDTLNRNNNE